MGRPETESRVLRGGSWNNNQDNARADYRNNNHPNNRNDNNGFRVVCGSHIHRLLSGCRQVSPTKVCGMRRRADGWRGHVPSARRLRHRAHTQARRRPGREPRGASPPLPGGLADPAAEKPPNLGDHVVDVLVLPVERLAGLRLTLHERSAQVVPVTAGIPWLGFVVYPTHRRVKARKVLRGTRRLTERFDARCSGRISFAELDASMKGWINKERYADTWGLRQQVLGRFIWGPEACGTRHRHRACG